MISNVTEALSNFTRCYVDLWQKKTGAPPASRELYGVPSPCITQTGDNEVYWLPQPFPLEDKLNSVEVALDIQLQPAIHDFYTSQLAGDMTVTFEGQRLSLIQVWSEDDFIRLQENLIGHLVTQKRLKLSPTAFIATMESDDMGIISLCNLTGEVILEQFGSHKRKRLFTDLIRFLGAIEPVSMR
ncbi:SecY-interacting protein [Photorhabdus bodei]|uniref:Protein Syd n=1 Tax=Photorhabdus bodei TaxID=2029681 RepID=A0A329X8L4_9GAMM|nr:SecY-interacting protein [Photorhabdus bodei]NDK98782.1 SecY-interacting protein [Photorhabdus bodei]NDL03126.1 SecY-interacting protein [Photorhabdus bodei]NDL07240.1 SecY-interacting protein [Photorhabdus bodei]RAX13169.1 SecY-interacting protein [Photorhabdus bodei]